MEIRYEVDKALEGTVEDYDASRFARDYRYRSKWPLEEGIADTLKTYRAMAT